MATSKELYLFIENDDWEGVKGLLDRGLDANAPFSIDNEYLPCTPLQQASGLGALRVIEGLIDRGADLKYSKTYGTPLYCAVSFDRCEAAKLLLSRGADPNARGPSQVEGDGKWTPLICAAFRKHVPMVNLLLSHGADPRIVSGRGIGVVTCAAYNQDIELMESLLQTGAPAPGNALLCAVERENERLVRVLLGAGCDASYIAGKVELADAEAGETPLSLAIKRLSIAKAMTDLQKAMGREQGKEACLRTIIAQLLRSGADPSRLVHSRPPCLLQFWIVTSKLFDYSWPAVPMSPGKFILLLSSIKTTRAMKWDSMKRLCMRR